MGFMTAKPEQARPKIQLVVSVTGGKLKTQLKEPTEADALLFSNTAVSVNEKITGMWLSKGDTEEVEKSIKAGVDFVILPVSGEVLQPDKKLGKIIQIAESISDIMLRTVGELPVDAVLLSESKESSLALTWKRLMLIRRFTGLAGKPLLVEVLPTITETEFQAIWDAGVSGVIINVDAEQAEDAAGNLRKIIEKLSFPSKRKLEKNMAIVPVVASTVEEPKEDDGDDGDDDDDE
jgi:hypothetical protein